jgi:hypothetical protein
VYEPGPKQKTMNEYTHAEVGSSIEGCCIPSRWLMLLELVLGWRSRSGTILLSGPPIECKMFRVLQRIRFPSSLLTFIPPIRVAAHTCSGGEWLSSYH